MIDDPEAPDCGVFALDGETARWRVWANRAERVELILDMRRDFAVDDEAMPLVLSLLDQLYGLRRQMRRLSDAIECQPAAIREAIRQALPKSGAGG